MERKSLNKFYLGSMGIKERLALLKMALSGKPTQGFFSEIISFSNTPKRGKADLLKNLTDHPFLNAVVRKIARGVATVPFHLYVVKKEGKPVKVSKSCLANKEKRKAIIEKKELGEVEEIQEHPLLELLEHGNEYMTGVEILQLTQIYLDLVGEAFWILGRNKAGVPVEIYPVPPHWVTGTPKAGYNYFEIMTGEGKKEVPASEMIWFRELNVDNPWGRGSGIGESLGDEIDTDEFASEHTKAWFYNRARPDILITGEGLTRADTERLEQDWNAKLQGVNRWFKPYFINRSIQVHEISQRLESMNIIELRKFERDIILQVYGMSPEVMGIIENSNRATIEAADYIFAKRVLEPRLEFLRGNLQEKLVPLFDERLIIDYEPLVLADKEYNLNVARSAPWALTIDEWREMMEKDPLPEGSGQVFMLPFNLLPSTSMQGAKTQEEEKTQKKKTIKTLNDDDVYELLEAVDEWHIAYRVHPVYKKIIEEMGQYTLDEYGIKLSFNLLSPRVAEFLDEQAGIYIKIIENLNHTTLRILRETLIEGVREGESIAQLSKRISDIFDEAKGYRAERIARTEVMRASNLATWEAFQQGGIERMEWIATRDDRVRDTHLAADGQVVDIGEKFVLGSGAKASYPGDPALPPEECINCRCTIAAVISQRSFLDTEEKRVAFWWKKEKERQKYDRLFLNALKKGFQEQQENILRLLRRMGRE